MMTRVMAVALALAALAGGRAWATTVIPPTFDELVAEAQYVFFGEVVANHAERRDSSRGPAIYTRVTFRVLEAIKGRMSIETMLEFLGGEVGEIGMRVEGMPQFKVGDRDILFVHGQRAVSPLVRLMHGRLRVLRDGSGSEFVATHGGIPLTSLAQIGRPERAAASARAATGARGLSVGEAALGIRAKMDEQLRRR